MRNFRPVDRNEIRKPKWRNQGCIVGDYCSFVDPETLIIKLIRLLLKWKYIFPALLWKRSFFSKKFRPPGGVSIWETFIPVVEISVEKKNRVHRTQVSPPFHLNTPKCLQGIYWCADQISVRASPINRAYLMRPWIEGGERTRKLRVSLFETFDLISKSRKLLWRAVVRLFLTKINNWNNFLFYLSDLRFKLSPGFHPFFITYLQKLKSNSEKMGVQASAVFENSGQTSKICYWND